jgi:hypothetical protein
MQKLDRIGAFGAPSCFQSRVTMDRSHFHFISVFMLLLLTPMSCMYWEQNSGIKKKNCVKQLRDCDLLHSSGHAVRRDTVSTQLIFSHWEYRHEL